jgi:mRNA interferase RelE/StbE
MDVWVDPPALAELRALPGHLRQRVRRAVRDLAQDARPANSRDLELSPAEAALCPSGVEIRRLRLESWRIVYAVDAEWQAITVLAVRRRPPYQYDDLAQLVGRLT